MIHRFKVKLKNITPNHCYVTRLYVNIAQDCESFKAIKGNTRLCKVKVILHKQKHSFLLAKAYERSHKSDITCNTCTTYFILRL